MKQSQLGFLTHIPALPAFPIAKYPSHNRLNAPAFKTALYSQKRRRSLPLRSCTEPSKSTTKYQVPEAQSSGKPNTSAEHKGASEPSPTKWTSQREEPAAEKNEENGEQGQENRPDSVRFAIGNFSVSIPARWLLYAVPFLWGSFGPAVRLLFSQEPHPEPSIFNTERLLLSTLVYVPVLAAEFAALRKTKKSPSASQPKKSFAFLKAGAELGVYVFVANVAQVIGLQQTSASRAAFLVQLQTVIVPVLAGIFGLDKITPKTWLSSVIAVGGVALLSSDNGHGTVSSLTGDALEVLSAFFFSTYIIRLSRYCNEVPANPLVATKIAVQAVLSTVWALSSEVGMFFNHGPSDISGAKDVAAWTLGAVLVNIGVVMWTGLCSSAISGWAQTRGQQGVPASEAVVIFATQPLWASALAAIVLGESFGAKGFGGGALIVAATLIAGTSNKNENEKLDV